MKPIKPKEVLLGALKADQFFYASDFEQYGQVISVYQGSVRVRLWVDGGRTGVTKQQITNLSLGTPVVPVADRPQPLKR